MLEYTGPDPNMEKASVELQCSQSKTDFGETH